MELRTIDRESASELEVKGSKFLAVLVPIERLDARLAALRAEHRKASHFVTATRCVEKDGQIADRARDDGEPGGTAGMPILRVLMGADLVDVGCVVIRYFGGTKLGTGGLARAYSGAAALAVRAAKPRRWARMATRTLSAGFDTAPALEQTIEALGLLVTDRRFTERGVSLKVQGAEDILDNDKLGEWER